MFACTELDAADQCVAWSPVIIGLPPLTEAEVFTLSSAVLVCWALALGVRFLINLFIGR